MMTLTDFSGHLPLGIFNPIFFELITLCVAKLLGLGSPADSSVISSERDATSVFKDIMQVFLGFLKCETLNGFGHLVGVFEVDTKVTGRSLGSYFYENYYGKRESGHLLWARVALESTS